MGNIKVFWARITRDSRRLGHEPTKSTGSAHDLEQGSEVPPPYSVLPQNSEKSGSHTRPTIAETGSCLVHKLGGALKTFRAGLSECFIDPRERVEQLSDVLRLCMVLDYWIPTSSSAAEPESLGMDWAASLGLKCADVPTDWVHLLKGLQPNWRKGVYEACGYSLEAISRIYMPAKDLGLDPLVVWTRVCEFDEGDLRQLDGTMDKPAWEIVSGEMTYIEHYVRAGMWKWVAGKVLHDRTKGLKALFTNKDCPDGIERYRQLYDTLRESITQMETKYFDRLISADDFTLSEYALDLCEPSDTYLACSDFVQRTLEAHWKKKTGRERVRRDFAGGAGSQDGGVCYACGGVRKAS
ncbi:hypothetical protein MMC27_004149 [Xylographa pallens]|nr:hypothetical protein [Xylographa pallens]